MGEPAQVNKRFISSKSAIFFILAVALVMRLIAINQSLWLDEAIGAIAVKNFSYNGVLTEFIRSDNHTPLYYLTLKAWTEVFGYSEISLRFPSVILGVLTVYLVYLIAKKFAKKNKEYPLLASLLLATSQFHIYYSQEARMYVMAGFFASLAIYAFLNVLEEGGKKYWYAFSLSIWALIFSDYVPVFLLPIFWIIPLMRRKKGEWWLKFVAAHGPLFLLGAMWFPTLLHQVSRGRWVLSTLPAWKTVAGGATFKQAVLVWMKFVFGRISLINKSLYYFLIVLASIPTAYSLFKSWVNRNSKINILWYWLIFPLIIGFLVSFWFPAFIYFRFTYVIPAFYLLIAWGVHSVKSAKFRKVVAACLIVANIASWLIYVFDFHQQREKWRQAVNFIENIVKDDEIAVFEFTEPFAPYLWYERGIVEAQGVTDSISANEVETRRETLKATSSKKGVYYFEYLRDLSDPQRIVEDEISKNGFIIDMEYGDFWGVGKITHFVKQ